jgi:two-component system, NtrC family, response regulator HydG
MPTTNSARRVLSVRTYPLLSLSGMLSGVVMVLRDDTHVADLEMELKEHRQFHRLVGRSDPMQKVYSLIKALARVQTTVLITGESGTGKELVAEALHLAGERSNKPLVKVNCSALPESLLESELFGHVRGAFTGAIRDNVGRFHRADGGTIFLDEVGDISAIIQLKLLRVLEDRQFERVGSSTPTKVDVRLIAATNRNLLEKVSLGELREDLYYRLKVVEIRLPPLRDRREDIPLLIEHFRIRFNAKFKKTIEAISSDVLKAFIKYPWPGNVRELEHTMEHAFVLCTQNIITFDHLPPDFMSAPGIERRSPDEMQDTDSHAILEALDKTAWNKAKAARLLGMDRVTLYRKIKRYNLTKDTP